MPYINVYISTILLFILLVFLPTYFLYRFRKKGTENPINYQKDEYLLCGHIFLITVQGINYLCDRRWF